MKMGDIASISYGFVNDCRDLETIDFTQTKSVPSLSVSNAFSGLHPNYKILVSGQLYPLWKRATNWAQYADHIKPVGDYVFLEQGGKKILEFGEATTINLIYETSSGNKAENVTIVANNPNLVSITNKNVGEDTISFDISAFNTEGDVTITVSADLGGKRLTSETNISVFDVSALNYRVEDVDGATYGFEFNEDGWWESTNKGVSNSYAICKIVFNVTEGQRVSLDCINYGDQYYSFGIVSKIDTALGLNYNTDGSSLYQKSFYNETSPNVKNIGYGTAGTTFPVGEHFIYAKYKRQTSGSSVNKDSLQFRLRIE